MASGLENIETIESPFRRFVTTIGVFPTAFTDAMTYYECLAYLVKYLEDTVITAVNENAEALEELQTLYIQLKSYVDNYFANLDIQEEINNKLDAMAEDGTLQEIITAYIQSNVAWTFDTVADMKQATNLVAGSYAQTLGFHTINDGGGATYYISDSGTADEMQVIAVGSLYANLVLTSEVTPEMFGAYGDNSHDDSASIQKAFDSGRVVRLLHKTYLTNSTINISGDYVEFNGTEGTINYTGELNAILFGRIDHGKINLGRILADNGNCIRAYSTNGLTAPADYIVYLDLHFEQLRAKYKCISFETSGTGFINEVRLYGGNLSGGEYGVHYVADVNHDFTGTDGFYCYDLCFEGTVHNYYFESPYHRFRGIECINDRYVENLSSTHITLVGNFTSCHWQSWGNMDESRIDLSQANVKLNLNFDFPILNSDASAIFASGIKYDTHSRKSYVFEEYIRHYPSGYGSHVTGGAVRCYKVNNMCYLELKGVIGDATSFEILDADHKLPFQFIPTEFERSYSCTTPDGYNGVVNVLTDGTLTIWTNSSASIGKPFYGTLVYDPMINTNPS